MKPIDELMIMVDERISKEIEQLDSTVKQMMNLLLAVGGLFLVGNLLLFRMMNVRIIRTISNLTNQVQNTDQEQGYFEEIEPRYNDEFGLFINVLNKMQQTIRRRNTKVLEKDHMIDRYILSVEMDNKGIITYASDAFCRTSEYAMNEVIGIPYTKLFTKNEDGEFLQLTTMIGSKEMHTEVQGIKKNGDLYWGEVFIDVMLTHDERLLGYRWVIMETTNRKAAEMLAETDQLTGLNNRLKLDQCFLHEIQQAQRYGSPFSVILLDIDLFKKINDNHGHMVGDRILKEFSNLLRKNIRETDTLGRWGGEEFLIICPKIYWEGAKKAAEKLRQIIDDYEFEGVGQLTASFGITEYASLDTVEKMMNRVDQALYIAKDKGRNRCESI